MLQNRQYVENLTISICINKIRYHLKESILEGGCPFERTHGTSIFGYASKDGRIGDIFNNAMSESTLVFKKIIQMYKGFEGEGIQTVVDVGGGTGATLNLILSNHPSLNL